MTDWQTIAEVYGPSNWRSYEYERPMPIKCPCPYHDDKNASATLWPDDYRLRMYCHALCDFEAMLDGIRHLLPSFRHRPQTSIGSKTETMAKQSRRVLSRARRPEDSDTYPQAKQIYERITNANDEVKFHPYARGKNITRDFGAYRIKAEFYRRERDCLVIPAHSLTGEFYSVELIADKPVENGGKPKRKQHLGYKAGAYKVLGNPEDAPLIHFVEGWATAYGAAQLFPKRFAAVVSFGGLDDADVKEIESHYQRPVIAHPDSDGSNTDLHDLWVANQGGEYIRRLGLPAELLNLITEAPQ